MTEETTPLQWEKPQLLVLARTQLEEQVLTTCKDVDEESGTPLQVYSSS